MPILQPDRESISAAAAALAAGRLVAFPTETVYGLGASARSQDAIKRLYEAKGRPSNHPVIVHLSSITQLEEWASSIPPAARKLAGALWPGPLTLILPKAEHVADFVTGGQTSVGLRVPQHPVALALLREFGDGVAAPSANKFGRLSPTSAQDVADEFGGEVEFVLDGGLSEVGIESTIVDFSASTPKILRPGMITAQQMEAILGMPLSKAGGSGVKAKSPVGAGLGGSTAPHETATTTGQHLQEETRAPGGLLSHYAPRTPLYVVPSSRLLAKLEQLHAENKSVCVLAFQSVPSQLAIKFINAADNPRRFSHELYGNLRQLDKQNADCILVEAVPSSAEWAGPADRLQRASVSTGK